MSRAIASVRSAWSRMPTLFHKDWQKAYKPSRMSPKYTVQPKGVWAVVSKLLAIDSTRSTGIPLNPQFRNPPPGGLDPNTYDDPTTIPAADLANNPYWKRDVRRGYPQLSTVTQGDVVALLSVGSQAKPKEDVLQLGDAGKKQLVQVKQDSEEKGLASFLQGQTSVGSVLTAEGLPPMPPSLNHHPHVQKYELNYDQSYKDQYPCRNFQ
ncbi:21 kDa subunit of NADH dehydrogenase [Microthyrium microscopicum]|uniref:21 kDa subunit of NADH dehydrogenase n=1 Tax=Microthyrium microscopicum TaxID=703497 RepID=A0A6A6UM89_9PEZI|nr:21 kDa subunit of NADH dehydrogenase [Microthyrium microscopicum]